MVSKDLLSLILFLLFALAVGSSISGLSGLYTVAMKAAGASRRVFQLLDRASSMPKSGDKCPLGLVHSFSCDSLSILIHVKVNGGSSASLTNTCCT